MRTVPLESVAKFVRGVTFKPRDKNDDGVAVMRTTNVQASLDLSDIIRIPSSLVKRPEQYLQGGDTLVSSANSWYAVGRACWVPEPAEPMVVGGFVTALRPSLSEVDPKYLFHWFTSPRTQATLRSFSNKTTNISNLNLRLANKMPVELPPLGEQQRIAAILDHADALRAKRRQVLAHLDDLTQSIFHDMFGGSSTAAYVEELAEDTRGSIRTGPFGSQLLHGEFVDEGVAVLGLDNVVGNEFRWAEKRFITETKYAKLTRYTVRPGDVLVSIMGTTGRCAVVPDGIPTAVNTKHLCAITVDRFRMTPEFLRAAFLWHPESRAHLHRQTKGSIMNGLNMGIVKSMPVPVPDRRVQEEFSQRSQKVDALNERIRVAASIDDELFASLQSRAFKGEL